MRNLFSKHFGGFWSKENKQSLYVALLLIVISIFVQIDAGHYSSEWALSSNYVNDLFLDNLPIIHIDLLIVIGGIMLWVVGCWLLVVNPKRLLFGLKAIALYVMIRAFFISLTHIGIYPNQFAAGSNGITNRLYEMVTFQGNYFFSGHTGFPFLLALIFWENIRVRNFFICLSIFFGVAVLLAHVHYSIDVFAAPFMVYGIYKITEKLFPRDHQIMTD